MAKQSTQKATQTFSDALKVWRSPSAPQSPLEHIRLRIGEAKYFLDMMSTQQQQWQYNVRRKRMDHALREREKFLYCFHAFLSATRTARFYLHRAVRVDKMTDKVKTDWLKSRTSGIIFKVFDGLRNFQAHDESLQLATAFDVSGGVEISGQAIRQSIGPLSVPLDISTMEVVGTPVVALDVGNLPTTVRRDFALYSASKRDGTKILVICSEYVNELEQVVNYGVALGHIADSDHVTPG